MHKLEVLQKDNKWIVDFHKETMAEGGIAEEKILAAETILKGMFADLDDRLSRNEWILGDQMTLADIAWIPQYALFQRNNFPLSPIATGSTTWPAGRSGPPTSALSATTCPAPWSCLIKALARALRKNCLRSLFRCWL